MISVSEIIKFVNGSCLSGLHELPVSGISIDSRTLTKGECFIAVRGERSNGHTFLLQAGSRQASAFIVDEEFAAAELSRDPAYAAQISRLPNVIIVPDTVRAMGDIAGGIRRKYSPVCVGITGSCGKSTTKELTAALLGKKYRTLYSAGNFNNQFGLPLTLSRLSSSHQMVVSEMGASRKGDIEYLTGILQPEVGVLTNVHPVHLEGFGSLGGVYSAKLELAEYLDRHNGTLIMCGDDDRLRAAAAPYNVNLVTFGLKPHNDFVVTHTAYHDGKIEFRENDSYTFRLNSIARYDVLNAAAALAVSDHFKIDFAAVGPVFEDYAPLEGRFRIFDGDIRIIDDSYNANPHSFTQVLDLVRRMRIRGRKVIVCGDMLELGRESELYHRRLAHDIAAAGADRVVGIGTHMYYTIDELKKTADDIPSAYFNDTGDALLFLREEVRPRDVVLVKGSRGIHLEDIVQGLANTYTADSNLAL